MEKYGLTEKETELLKSAFEKFPQVETVFIYGSRAKNTFRKTSDIDLAVKFKNGNDAGMAQLKSALDDLPIIYEIDLTDEAKIQSGDFKDEYNRTKQIFYLKGWKTITLGEVAALSKSQWNPGDKEQKYIGLEHINQGQLTINGFGNSSKLDSNKFYFKTGDVLFGKLRPYFRKVWKAKFDGVCSTEIWVLRAKENNDQDFLFYLTANPVFIDKSMGANKGTHMPRADWDFLKNTEWNIPPLPEQRGIAEVLSSLDDKIELLREQNKTLEATAQAIFKEWFVNFNYPEATGKMIDSALGKIPEGWRVGKLGEEFKIEYGKSDKNFDADGLHPVYGAGGIVGYSNFADYRDYQVIIGCRGTCGNITLAYEDSKITHNSLIISSDWFKPFIYLYLHSVDIGKAITGSTQPQITIGDLDNIEILIPQNKIVSTFVEIIAPIFKKKGNNNSQIQTLSALRDALLPKLMKGELRVKI